LGVAFRDLRCLLCARHSRMARHPRERNPGFLPRNLISTSKGFLFMSIFRGLFPPLITPFDEQLRVNEKALRDHVDFVIESGVDGVCAGSSTGEFMNLTREEWEAVLDITKSQVNGRVPIIAGGADMSTPATVE